MVECAVVSLFSDVVDCVVVSGVVVLLGGGTFCAPADDAASAIAASEAIKSFISSLLLFGQRHL
jgi:hypothetical protein